MANVLTAFLNIVENYNLHVETISDGNNRINNMGDGLENYIKCIFANTSFEETEDNLKKFETIFSYQGNKSNPPDLILKNSDAIEIKKIESKNSALALNSSYPKDKLYANSPMITTACRDCETWEEKDMLYAIGYVSKKRLKSLYLVYGDCFCANFEIYEKIKNTISSAVNSIEEIEPIETNELGKIKKVDPLGITDLRIREMWHIQNPNKTFDYIYNYDDTKDFQLVCIIKDEKYNSMPQNDKNAISSHQNISIKQVKIKNPNNPIKLMDAKLITFGV